MVSPLEQVWGRPFVATMLDKSPCHTRLQNGDIAVALAVPRDCNGFDQEDGVSERILIS